MFVYDRKLITEKWSNLTDKNGNVSKLAIGNIEDPYVKEVTAVLLENQRTQYQNIATQADPFLLFEASQASNTLATVGGNTNGVASTSSYQFQPISIALTRRAMPELFAHKVVGVQPMSTPVGLAYALRKIYASNNTDNIEAGWDNIPEWAGYTGSTVGTSAILDNTIDGIYDTSATGANATSAEAWDIGLSGSYPQIKVKVDMVNIVATTRKLATSYSLESQMDLKTMLGVELEKEMVDFLQYELVAELDRELLYRMKKAATDTTKGGALISSVNVSGTAIDGRWSQEKFSNIINAIVHQSNVIATATREGAGNFVVVSPTVATVLQSAPAGVFTRNTSIIDATRAGVAEIGSINGGTIKVYRDSQARGDFALVGFKGAMPTQSGIIYSPYLLGLTSRAISQEDFSPRIGTMMRGAITDTILGSGRYYRLIPFTNLSSIIVTA